MILAVVASFLVSPIGDRIHQAKASVSSTFSIGIKASRQRKAAIHRNEELLIFLSQYLIQCDIRMRTRDSNVFDVIWYSPLSSPATEL